MTPETRYANSGGVSMACQVLGEGALDLVVVPAWVSNLDVAWEEPAVGDPENITGAIEAFLTGVRYPQIDDRGVRPLKGVPGDWPLFAARR